MLNRAAVLVLLAALPTLFDCTAAAAAATRVQGIEVHHDGDDPVGVKLAFQVRELIRRTASMRIQETGTRFVVYLVTSDVAVSNGGRETVYGVTWVFYDGETRLYLYIVSGVGAVSTDRIDSAAATIVANTDAAIAKWFAVPSANRLPAQGQPSPLLFP
jgi:hypothetical protein